MRMFSLSAGILAACAALFPAALYGGVLFELDDVFRLQYATDPQIHPNGRSIVYVRNSMNRTTDKVEKQLWVCEQDGSQHQILTGTDVEVSSPRWSPDGSRLAYLEKNEKRTKLFLRPAEGGEETLLAELPEVPKELVWSPDGQSLAFSMLVKDDRAAYAKLPQPPEDSKWAKPFTLIDALAYREDGEGYAKHGFHHLFVISIDGGASRQVTSGPYHHRERPAWSSDSQSLYFSANRNDGWEHEPLDSDIYRVELKDLQVTRMTDRKGPEQTPVLSRNGKWLAYAGFEDTGRSYQQRKLYLMPAEGGAVRCLTTGFDRDVVNPTFKPDSQGIYFQFDEEGVTKIGYLPLASPKVETVAVDVGGTTLGRPYSSGSYSMCLNGGLNPTSHAPIAFTRTTLQSPADVAISDGPGAEVRVLTQLNRELLDPKQLANVESFWYESSADGQKIQGWIVKPPFFDPEKKYPLILEIHGGPYANYGNRFAAELQLYAAAGYIVLYVNPRGSTSYGDKFTSFIDFNYPSQDYDDLMSGVDAVIEKGYIDPDRLYVTGGSGGGVLSSWTIGKTSRFQAAAVVNPVINWYSFVLTSDHYSFFARYWFRKFPWEEPQEYLRRSPITYVGNVTTPTLLMTGEADYRTPISESEQFYHALKLRKVEAMLLRVPEASHNIGARPSHMISKVAHILKWFESHPRKTATAETSSRS